MRYTWWSIIVNLYQQLPDAVSNETAGMGIRQAWKIELLALSAGL